jgi:Concanavalin A-like lectin/glucanases superfamily
MKIKFIQMKFKYLLLLIIVIIYSNDICAQNNLNRITGLSSTTASVAYSLRQLSTSYTGPLVRIKVASSFYDVYPDATTYNFSLSSKISAAITNYNDAAAVAGTSALSSIITSSINATVAAWYDQSGNGVHVYSINATAKIITAGAIITMNGQPTITFGGSSASTYSSFTSSATVNYNTQTVATINAVAQNSASTSDYSGIISTGDGGGWGISYNPNTNTQQAYSSGVPTGTYLYGYFIDGSGGLNASSLELTTTSPKIVTGLVNKTTQTSSIYSNSSLKNSNTSTTFVGPGNGTNDKIYVGQRGNFPNRNFVGNISETFIFNKILTTAEQTALETSQAIFLPPSVTITSNPTGSICPGATVTYTATTSNIASPSFQWYLNGAAITSATASTYSTTTLTNNDKITVIATPSTASTNIVNGPNLKSNLDAGNSSSYSGSGTTWTDLTGNGNKVTLTGTGYTNVNGGGITFNTSSTYGTQTFASPPFNGDFTWSSIYKAPPLNGNGWDRIYSTGSYTAFHVGHVNGRPLFSFENWYPGGAALNTSGEATLTPGNYYMVTFVRSGNTLSSYVQASPYGTNGTASGAVIPVSPITVGKGPDSEAWENGVMNVMLIYNYALSQAEIVQNVNFYASRFGYGLSGYISNAITTTVSLTTPVITVSGEACTSKATLTTPTGLSSYAWYKDNVLISGATSNSYVPSSIGEYQVQVSNGTCTAASLVTTVYNCVVNVNGKIVANSNVNASAINSPEGGTNFGTGKDISGKLFNTTGISSIIGTIGSTTAVIGGVISPTNAITTSIGVIYSTDINFGTYSTTTIQSNVPAGSYSSTISGLTSLTTYFAKSFIVNKAGTSYGPVVTFPTQANPILLGSTYGGGVVAYIYQSVDPGYVAGQMHGIIISNELLNNRQTTKWTSESTPIFSNATGAILGSGLTNTNTIYNTIGSSATAVNLCLNYSVTVNGISYSDWYLPSIDEFKKMGEAAFASPKYSPLTTDIPWFFQDTGVPRALYLMTSTEIDSNNVWLMKNNNYYDSQPKTYYQTNGYAAYVRAIRYF